MAFIPSKTLSLSYRLGGFLAPPPEILSTTLEGGEEVHFSFAHKVNLPNVGAHFLAITAISFPDDNGNNNQTSRIVGNFPNPRVNIGNDTLLCGLDDLTLDPGVPGQNTYLWNTGDTTATVSAFAPGPYKIWLTDTHGCKGADSIIISKMPALTVDQKWIEHVRCYGDSTGAVEIELGGGLPPYDFQWVDGFQGFTRSKLPAGNYAYTLVDQVGCQLADHIALRQNDSLAINVDLMRNAGCPIDSSGAIYLSMTGGEQPYAFLWNTGAISQNLPRLPEGDYRVNVIDKNGCSILSPIYEIKTADTLPSAKFTYKVSGGTVTFLDSSQNAIQYTWTFGDDSGPVTDTNPTYTYRQNGKLHRKTSYRQ